MKCEEFAESGRGRNFRHRMLRVPEQEFGIFEPHDLVGQRRRHADRALKMPFKLPPIGAETPRQVVDRHRRVDVLLHQEQRLLHHRIVGMEVERNARLRFLGPLRFINDHDVQALASLRAADMLFDQIGGKMRRADAARTGQPIAVDNENLVGDWLQPVELLKEIVVVKPTDAAAVAVHQSGAV